MSYEALTSLLGKAEELNTNGKFDEAETLAGELLEKLEKINEVSDNSIPNQGNELRCRALIALSVSKWKRGDDTAALPHALASLDLVETKNISSETSAKAYSNIATVYMELFDYIQSLTYSQKALDISEESGDKNGTSIILGNIGIVYLKLSDFTQAISYCQKSITINEEIKNKYRVATTLLTLGNIYIHLSDYKQALISFENALTILEASENKYAIAINLGGIGIVYSNLSDYPQALNYYQKALAINEEIGSKDNIASNLGNIGIAYENLSNYQQALAFFQKALAIYEELGSKDGIANNLGNIGRLYSYKQFDGYDAEKAEEYMQRAIALCKEIGDKRYLYELHDSLASLYEMQERWKEHSIEFKKYHQIEKEVQSEEATKQAQLLENRRKVEEAERDRQVKLARFQEQEKILLNILPEQIAERILEGEKRIADLHEHVSVFFSDIVGFTKLSQTITPDELLSMLNEIFSEFDRISRKHGLEKIKTIGDAYMAVAGVPMAQEDHTKRAASFALDVIDFMKVYRKTTKSDLQIRVGLHCGAAIAGVIGENKFAYDLWGDAVNTASRMESHGEAGKIHISEDFKNTLGNDYIYSERGQIDVKGKGKMKTYFLEKEL